MSDDLVKRLREYAENDVGLSGDELKAFNDVADRIEDLKVAIERIANHHPEITHAWAEDVRQIARRALWGGKHE